MPLFKIFKSLIKLPKYIYLSICDYIVLVDLPQYIDQPEFQLSEKLTCKKAANSDLEHIKSIFGERVYQKFVSRMDYADGFLVMLDRKIAGYCWSSNQLCPHEGVPPFVYDIYPKKDTLYFFDAYIRPDLRGKGLYSKMFQFRIKHAREKGFKRVFFLVDARNQKMLHFCQKQHFCIIGQLRYRKILWFKTKDLTHLKKVCRSDKPEKKLK